MKRTYTLAELPDIASMILENINSKTLLLYGEMGVGKTTLVKELASKLGIKDSISSPTFSIVNEYHLAEGKLYHFDFYRIHDETELLDIGIEDYLETNYWKLIEWPEKISEKLLPYNRTTLKLTKNTDGSRTIQIMPMN
ncbi:MAG: tRNA (adenosine(37)-N6)-threonylcarbamoyltransferase complex ATPase subunit type 1 TsaE [Flavobacteriaceae bacterium]|jgi:tRNA threonylcarbamoyladenosine biosynthesis protein TsaE|nr:tRNA (adenosine(37)-N6)-threonylcarbamoyltransferase complex ATPase subunit type 1 TsaE [Flavobacteriaceae bacterium]|tara:strand:+ start:139700 stop:140116 length:417 start_codon:yes stop_codon:yes gene_type:complete